MKRMTDLQERTHRKLQENLPFFVRNAPLLIKPKVGDLVPLKFNRAQNYLHDRAEAQKARIGKVRLLVVKARKEGVSTYVGARFYHQTTRRRSIYSFILSHDASTTDTLFNMVKLFQEKIHPSAKPYTSFSNKKELVFPHLTSAYLVGTAGNDTIGRGQTIQRFHGSEVAYWRNTQEIRSGILEAIPDDKDTEIILESTANGIGNMFHEMVTASLQGKSDYEVVFIPWFWMDEYAREAPSDFVLTDEEMECKELYGLTLEQMAWRRAKIENLGNLNEFKREYPANVNEAFETSGSGLFNPAKIMEARKSSVTDKNAPLVMGVDPARSGDRTIIVFRRGREMPHFYKWEEMDSMRLAGICAQLIQRHNPAGVFIDIGEGHGTIDRLHELGFNDVVMGVPFGKGALREDVYVNKRAEMYCDLRDWIHGGGVKIPDSDELHKDLSIIPDYKKNSSSKIYLVPKDKIISDNHFSPDIADAMALTFAYPVNDRSVTRFEKPERSHGGITTLKKMRGGRE